VRVCTGAMFECDVGGAALLVPSTYVLAGSVVLRLPGASGMFWVATASLRPLCVGDEQVASSRVWETAGTTVCTHICCRSMRQQLLPQF
jgi:hypothetical protein